MMKVGKTVRQNLHCRSPRTKQLTIRFYIVMDTILFNFTHSQQKYTKS